MHPVPPVLDETRAVVLSFQSLLEREVAAAAARPQARGHLHVLRFAGGLLDATGGLREGLALDGTHMAPAYLQYLQQALDGCR